MSKGPLNSRSPTYPTSTRHYLVSQSTGTIARRLRPHTVSRLAGLTLILLSSTTGPCGLFFVIVALMTRLKAASYRTRCKPVGGAGEGQQW